MRHLWYVSFECQRVSTLRSRQISSNARSPNSYTAAQYSNEIVSAGAANLPSIHAIKRLRLRLTEGMIQSLCELSSHVKSCTITLLSWLHRSDFWSGLQCMAEEFLILSRSSSKQIIYYPTHQWMWFHSRQRYLSAPTGRLCSASDALFGILLKVKNGTL